MKINIVNNKKMIQISNIEKSYDRTPVLQNVSLNIEEGDIYGLIGKSGAGKSTLLRCMNKLETFKKGRILVDNIDISSLSRVQLRRFRKSIGMIFQHFSLLERKTVYDNIALPLKCWKFSKNEIDERVNELVGIVGLNDKLNEKARNLSGGQKQRVAIARALALNPKILLCDEATSALDPKTTKDILSLLKKINKELSITIVIVTHQMSVVQQICNKMAILENGVICEYGKVEEIFLKQPNALKNLLGYESQGYTGEKFYLEIFITPGKEYIISDMANVVGQRFDIISGNIEQYRELNYGHFILRLNDKVALHKYIEYMDSIGEKYNIISENCEVSKNA